PDGALGGYGATAWVQDKLIERLSAGFADRNPTTADYLDALYALKGETIGGLVPPITFNKGAHAHVNKCGYPIRVVNAKPTAAALSALTLGSLHLLTKTPLRSYAVSAAYDDGNRSDVLYEAFTDPFAFSLDAGADIGKDHYESMGRVTGTVTVAGAETGGLHQPPPTQTEVAGWAYQDHSWGPRHWGMLLSHRWVWATFGPDLFCSAFSFTTPRGRM